MLQVISGDSSFLKRIEQASFCGTVHSLFKRVLNIRCLDSEVLYTIACRDIDNGPNTLILDIENLLVYPIELKETVHSAANQLVIGSSMKLTINGAKGWKCSLPKYPSDDSKLRANLPIMKQYLDEFGQSGGMISTDDPQSSFQEEVSRLLQERSTAFLSELKAGRMEKAIQTARSLIGLGPGLTPSGDDFLLGLLAVINLQGNPLHAYSSWCQEILRGASQWTNEISLAALNQAASGQVRESITKLIDALTYRTPDQVIAGLSEVLNIGSSSGTDISMGIYSGLQLVVSMK
jgi:hypothetical protein